MFTFKPFHEGFIILKDGVFFGHFICKRFQGLRREEVAIWEQVTDKSEWYIRLASAQLFITDLEELYKSLPKEAKATRVEKSQSGLITAIEE